MFALFTRVSWILLQPSSLICVALTVGTVALWRGRVVAARRWITGALATLLIIGLTPLSDWLIRPLEDRFPRPDLTGARIDGLVVLGGGEDANIGGARGVVAVNEAAERFIEAAALTRRFPNARLVFSGGGDPLTGTVEPEATSAARIFEALGVARERITLEDKSLTTWENAKLSAPMIAKKPGERWLLITSGWQMPRAIGAFRKVGVDLEAFPVDYRTRGETFSLRFFSSVTDGLKRFDAVVREYPGLLVYYLAGRSSALFPGPPTGP